MAQNGFCEVEPIPIDAFEQYIFEAILKRGLSYWRRNALQSVDELGPGDYSAVVLGTEYYDVYMRIVRARLVEVNGMCPHFDEWAFLQAPHGHPLSLPARPTGLATALSEAPVNLVHRDDALRAIRQVLWAEP